MTIKNTTESYGFVARLFHWLIALGVIGMLCFGFIIKSFDDKDFRGYLFGFHEAIGLTILMIVAFRIFWRWANVTPPLPSAVPRWQQIAAKAIHHSLYVLMVLMPLSGWVTSSSKGFKPSWFGFFDLPAPFVPTNKALHHFAGEVHEVTAYLLITLISLHILAALKHHFINKDNVLRRMWTQKST